MPQFPREATPVKRRILIVDAHPLLRRGLAALIDNESDLSVCAQAETEPAALAAIAADGADLVVADCCVDDGLGLGLTAEIHGRHPHLPVLLMSLDDDPFWDVRAMLAGACGHVSKRALDETALTAIRAALAARAAGEDPTPSGPQPRIDGPGNKLLRKNRNYARDSFAGQNPAHRGRRAG
jgi:DNA-binding NarL/FixJ family response regulator